MTAAETQTPRTVDCAEAVLAAAGVFKGHDGLRNFAGCHEFWAEMPYGTRFYFDKNYPGRYLHRSILRTAVLELDRLATLERALAEANGRAEKAEADARHVRQANENYRQENTIALARATAAEAELRAVRERTIEECAKVCERRGQRLGDSDDHWGPEYARRIRAAASALSAQQAGEPVAIKPEWWQKIKDVIATRFPRCRDCADEIGICPRTGLPCRLDDALSASPVTTAPPSGVREGMLLDALQRAQRVMHGEGVEDQGEAWDRCALILDEAITRAAEGNTQ